jgi:hypothetical protein
MTTLAEKLSSLSPERRKRIQERANELIAQEQVRQAKHGIQRVLPSSSIVRVQPSAKLHYFRKAGKLTMGKRRIRRTRRIVAGRSRGFGNRR